MCCVWVILLSFSFNFSSEWELRFLKRVCCFLSLFKLNLLSCLCSQLLLLQPAVLCGRICQSPCWRCFAPPLEFLAQDSLAVSLPWCWREPGAAQIFFQLYSSAAFVVCFELGQKKKDRRVTLILERATPVVLSWNFLPLSECNSLGER